MIQKREVERLYWEQEKTYNIVDQGDYAPFYEHLKTIFLKVIKSEFGNMIPNFTQNFMQAFLGNLKRITLRTLIFEMELCEECKELQGETEEEKYHYFVDHFLENPICLKEIYKEYPVMYQDMLSFLTLSTQNICEVIKCFALDIKEINFRFFQANPCHRIQKIDCSASDLHNYGKTVLILELDNREKLVYKPRSLTIDQAYKEFLQWVCKNLEIPYWWNSIWNRGEYGWCSWVPNLPCTSYDAIRQYYKRSGILLGIGYLLGSEDMHYENLIAHGEYPVLVDLELAIGSRNMETLEEAEEGKRVFMESVLQTGLLPMYVWKEGGEGVNVGAINGGGNHSVSMDFPVVVNPGTIQMRVEYQKPCLKEGKNRAILDGKFIQPNEFLREILLGFEKTYMFFVQNKSRVFEKLKEFEETKIRYVARQTQEYFLVLISMYHPDYLISEEEQDVLLEQLIYQRNRCKEEKIQWVRVQEGKELKSGDIPYFWYKANSTNLHNASGDTYENYFLGTSIQCIKSRLFQIDQQDMEYQKKLIQLVISTGDEKQTIEFKERNRAQRQIKVCIAERIGEILLEEAHWSKDKKSVGWINIIMADHQEQRYMIRPMGWYLYDGIAGVAVFMQGLAKKTKKKCYEEMADILTRKLFLYTDAKAERIQEKMPTGAFCGEASIAFAYMLLYLTNKDAKYLEYTKLQCEILSKAFTKDKDYDVIAGNAGAILVLLCAYKLTGDKQYMEWASEAGDILLSSATGYEWGMGWVNPVTKTALTGFAHGASGIMLALAKLGYITGDEKYTKAAYQAFLYEEHFFDEDLQDWKDLRGEVSEQEAIKSDKKETWKERGHGMAWCHGWAGILMARCLTVEYVTGEFREHLEESIRNFVKNKTEKGYSYKSEKFCLCHGNCGNIVLYSMDCMEKYGDQVKEKILEEMRKTTERNIIKLSMQEFNNYGLMAGITGIGYYFLLGIGGTKKILSIDI